MTLKAQSHKLELDAEVDLYIVDLNPINVAEIYYLTNMVDANSQPITYLGNTYQPWPLVVTGIDKRGSGSPARPTVEISNFNGFITDLCQQYQDMVGAKVTRRRTLGNYVLSNTAAYDDSWYFIEQRVGEDQSTVKFELSSPIDFLDKMLPGMVAVSSICPHRYKSTANGSGCSWPGTNSIMWFNADDEHVFTSAQDVCGKKISSCKVRFGENSELDYGGNPGLGRSNV